MDNSLIRRHMPPGRLFLGPGALEEFGRELPAGVKYLMVTDSGLEACGLAGNIAGRLRSAGLELAIFSRVESDPSLEMAEEAATAYRDLSCGGLIGVGGGSAIDAAKAAAVRLSAPGTLREYGRGVMVEDDLVPLYAVPTTAGTGSEVTRVSVITDTAEQVKLAVRGPHLAPMAAALDPGVLAQAPPRIISETGADALTHAVEAFISLAATPITDVLALAAIEMIAENLPALTADPTDSAAAEKMLLASNLAGQAFSNASVGLAHSLGEPLGAYHHVGHGLACALYLPAVMEFNLAAVPEKLARTARALGEDTAGMDPPRAAEAAVRAVRRLFRKVGLPLTFSQAGIEFELRPKMIEDVWPQYSTRQSPRRPTETEVVDLYHAPEKEQL